MQRTVRSIQILRGLAAWAVVLHHFTQVFYDFDVSNPVAKLFAYHGLLGVDVFFVVSGFVMHYTIAGRSRGALDFAVKRIARILPAYWVATFAIVLATLAGLIDPDYPFALWDGGTLLASLLWYPHAHPSGLGAYPVLTVGWTLNFEMFFYALLALCLALFRRHALIVAGVVLAVLPVVAAPDWLWGPVVSSPLLYEFIIGMALSAFFARGPLERLSPAVRGLVVLACLALALVGFFRGGILYGPLVAAGVVSAALAAERMVEGLPQALRGLLDWAGATSYSAYLWHPLVLFLLFSAFGAPSGTIVAAGLFAATILGTAGVAALGYRFVEGALGRRLAAALGPPRPA